MARRNPGDEWLILEEVPAGGTAQCPFPMSLGRAVQVVGGYTGEIAHPETGTKHQVDLTPFRGRDLDQTWLHLGCAWVDPRLVGTKGPGRPSN